MAREPAATPAQTAELQRLLNLRAGTLGMTPLRTDGVLDGATSRAMRTYASRVMGRSASRGDLATALAQQSPSDLLRERSRAREASAKLSGADWFRRNQARFPNSDRVADLAPAFAAHVTQFLTALANAGTIVRISSTRRNRIRAWLMHYAWQVSHGAVAAADVPDEPEAGILWDHGDDTRSVAAAAEMVRLFAIRFKPSLTSNHIAGLAIDMTITWSGPIEIVDAAGAKHAIDQPRNGNDNGVLHAVGGSYGVRKLLSDPPHWSVDGR
jgi:hypothetical protein